MLLSVAVHTLSPAVYILLCLFASAAFTWLLYKKATRFEKPWNYVLSSLRFLSGFLLFSLLLSPFISLKLNRESRPELLVYFDKSFSTTESNELYEKVKSDASRLNSKFNLRFFDFAGNVLNHGDSGINKASTDLGLVASHCNEFGESRNTSAMLVVSDGIFNRGQNPLFVSLNKNPRVFTLGLGDTIQYPDVKVTGLQLNESVFLGSEFVIEASISGKQLLEKAWTAVLSENGREVARKSGAFQGKDGFERIEFRLKAGSPGLKQYSIYIEYSGRESNKVNNTSAAVTEVVDTRKKIQMVMHSSHPDIGALRRLIEDQARYTLQVAAPGELPSPGSADIFIVHGMPADAREASWIEGLKKGNKSFWVISSLQTATEQLGPLSGISLPSGGSKTEDAQAYPEKSFSEFEPEPGWDKKLLTWPPLKVRYGKFAENASHKVLLRQKIGSVETAYPLFMVRNEGKGREAYLLGEGIWKWRMKDYVKGEGSLVFDDLVGKLLQYLGASSSEKKFICRSIRRDYNPGEQVVLIAENRDAAGNLVNQANCNLSISGPGGFSRTASMYRSNKSYRFDVGSVPAGSYNFKASLDGIPGLTSSGVFFVNDAGMERADKVANHGLLRQWSIKSGGRFFTLADYKKAMDYIANDSMAKPLIYEENSVTDLIHAKWFFLLIVVFLSAEWIIRKYLGQY
jgi:hypothetical protein